MMNESWTPILIFVSVTAMTVCLGALVYDWLFRYRAAVREHIEELSSSSQPNGTVSLSLFKDIAQLHRHKWNEKQTWKEWLTHQIDQAGIQCSVTMFMSCCAATGIVATSIGFLWKWWFGAMVGIAGTAIPLVVLRFRKNSRQRKLTRQLPEAFAMISRLVKSGQTVPSALQVIADDFEQPISAEFSRCYEQQNLGISRESALRQLAKRTGIMELQIFVVALLVQAKSGGDLVKLLDNLSTMIRNRLKLQDRVRALTGEGRMQALVLMILPPAALLGIIVVSPDYASSILERPWLLVFTAAAQSAGAFWIRKIVNFQY